MNDNGNHTATDVAADVESRLLASRFRTATTLGVSTEAFIHWRTDEPWTCTSAPRTRCSMAAASAPRASMV